MLLQYFKDGIVHVGYTVPKVYPDWAHQIRYEGLFFIGQPRRTPFNSGQSLYRIDSSEAVALGRYWTALSAPQIAEVLGSRSSKLRQSILRAGEYFEKSHETPELPEMVINLAIALEALFSPENQEQLRFRIAHSAAQYLGSTPEEKKNIFNDVSQLYGRRNALVHGGYSINEYYAGTFVSIDDVQRWSSLIRRAIVGFFVLALRGESDRRPILRKLEDSAFEPGSTAQLQEQSDLEMYFVEQGL